MLAMPTLTRRRAIRVLRTREADRVTSVPSPFPPGWRNVRLVSEEGRLVRLEIDIALVEEHLLTWAALFMGGGGVGGGGGRGYLGKTPGFSGSRGLASAEWAQEQWTEMDMHISRCVDGVVTGLPMHEQAAIWDWCGLATVARFPRLDMAKVLVDAKQHVGEGLVRKGVAV